MTFSAYGSAVVLLYHKSILFVFFLKNVPQWFENDQDRYTSYCPEASPGENTSTEPLPGMSPTTGDSCTQILFHRSLWICFRFVHVLK